MIITLVAILTHTMSGNVTGDALRKSLIAIPFVLVGSVAGFYLDRFINPAIFRKIVLGLLLILGINLALTWWRRNTSAIYTTPLFILIAAPG